MRVGLDCRLPYYRQGGISQYVVQLARALAGLCPPEWTISLWHSRRDGRNLAPAGAGRMRRTRAWTPPHHPWERWTLGAELWFRRLDLFHAPDFIPPAWGVSKRVITVHDLNFWHYPQFLTPESRRYYLGQIEWAVSAADRIAADSEHTRQDLINLLNVPPAKIRTIPLAANPLFSHAPDEAGIRTTLSRLKLPVGFVLFVGTLEPRKNIPTLLRAYHLARQAHGVTQPLVLVGRPGWLFEAIDATLDELQLQPHVRHLDACDDQTLARLYRAAGCLVLPSYYEGFGLPPLEAMLSGCPVIVSDRASLPEVVGEAGLLLEPDDVEAWAESLGRVLHCPELNADLRARGPVQAARFSWEATARATLALYQEALSA